MLDIAVVDDEKVIRDYLCELIEKQRPEGRMEAYAAGEELLASGRMFEFFMYDGEEGKKTTYQRASDLFYQYYKEYFESGMVERLKVPFKNGYLPVMHAKARGETKDRILLHGGNDSYYEELFFPMLYLAKQGFEVYLFEGPGQLLLTGGSAGWWDGPSFRIFSM